MGRTPFAAAVVASILLIMVAAGPAFARGRSVGGEQLWAARQDQGSSQDVDEANDVVTSPDGSTVFATGWVSNPATYVDLRTAAYNASTGDQMWVTDFTGPGRGIDQGEQMVVSPDGSTVYVVGTAQGSRPDVDVVVIAYDATSGTVAWTSFFDGRGHSNDSGVGIAVTPDGSRLLVGGTRYGSQTDQGLLAISFDAATGSRLWWSQFRPKVSSGTGLAAIALSPDGSTMFLTGSNNYSGTDFEYFTVACDAATGQGLWFRRFAGQGDLTVPSSIGVNPDGSLVFVTGQRHTDGQKRDYLTVAYDTGTGARAWSARYGPHQGGSDGAARLALSPDGSTLYVTGASEAPGQGFDVATLAYDAHTGGRLWIARYDGQAHQSDAGSDIVSSPDGSKVFVTGLTYESSAAGDIDYLTLAYDATNGSQLWASTYSGPDDAVDQAYAVAASPDGSRVFVTGESTGATTGYDWATVAYAA